MIDKINVNGGYDYPNHGNSRKNAAVQAYENTPGTKEAAKQRTGQKKQSTSYANAKKQGVILDISSKPVKEESADAPKQRKENLSFSSILQKIFAPARQAVHWMKNFWHAGVQEDSKDVLEDTMAAQTKQETGAADGQIEPAQGTEPGSGQDIETLASFDKMGDLPPLDTVLDDWDIAAGNGYDGQTESISAEEKERILTKAIKDADLQQIERLLTQNGTKHPAHNSDLLTYYNRKGRLVEMDGTEKHRVLFGDKNVFKL